MTEGNSVTVRGAERLAATLARAGRDIGAMRTANAAVAANVSQAARGRAPRRTGALARSTVGRPVTHGASISATVVYAGVIHNGWAAHNIAANPYIASTITTTRDRTLMAYQKDAQSALDRVRGA